MWAICKKEIQSYFYSPIGYVFIAMFMVICAIIFMLVNLDLLSTSPTPTSDYVNTLGNMISFFGFIVPVLTMRSFAEEKKSKTDQLLLTAPIKIHHVVLGKYLATLAVLLVTLALNILFVLVLDIYGSPDYFRIFAAYLGFFLLGATFLAIGIFISSLTESQVVAAVIMFALSFMFILGNNFFKSLGIPLLNTVVSALSIYDKYSGFSQGIIGISPIIYYISFSGLFVFLTVRVIERRRWIGA